MQNRKAILTWTLSLAASLTLHVSLFGGLSRLPFGPGNEAPREGSAEMKIELVLEPPPEPNQAEPRHKEPEELVLGKDQKEDRPSKAWIAYDDDRKLVAPKSIVDQPTTQNKVDPVAKAAAPRNPTPPRAVAAPSVTPPAPPQPPVQPTTVSPAKLIEATSPVPRPSPKPVALPKAVADDAPMAPPRPQAPAEGPRVAADLVRQPAVEAPRAGVSAPASQPLAALPQPVVPFIDPASARSPLARNDAVTQPPAKSVVPHVTPNPAQQPRGETPTPQPGQPSQQPKVDAPAAVTGVPAPSPQATTKQPTPRGQLASAKPADGEPADEPAPTPRPADPTPAAAPSPRNPPVVRPQPPSTASPQEARPTSSPRDEGNTPPVIIDDKKELPVTPGGVITRPGIQIVAHTPDITATSWIISGPTAINPIARITFDNTGRVRLVQLTRSSGHVNLDSPIIAAFYNFRAKGEKLQQVQDTFTITVRLLLKDEREDSE